MITETVVLVKISVRGSGPGSTELRLVKWGDSPPVLENRQFIIDPKTKKLRGGRLRGITLEDMDAVLAQWPLIKEKWENAR